MEKIKDHLKENKSLYIVLVIAIVVVVGLNIYTSFKEKNEEYNPDPEYMKDVTYVKKNYKVNEYTNVTIELQDLLSYYMKYYKELEQKDSFAAYEMLSSKGKERFHNSYDEFKEYLKNYTSIHTLTSPLAKYKENEDGSYVVIDEEGNKFTIIEKATWDFQVIIEEKADL